jgi:zinc D-Ala-D-Ala dipeptidase
MEKVSPQEEPILLARLQTDDEHLLGTQKDFERTLSELEIGLLHLGLVNIRDVDPTLLVELKYASTDNFMMADVYGEMRNCFLRPSAAQMLKEAHDLLKERHPELRLLIADGFRPRRVQHRMWEIVKDTPMQPYVANPHSGSIHNYGAAVDLTLALADGTRLDMGTPIDHFGILAQPRLEERFLREGKLTQEQVANRLLLREVMTAAGFIQLPIEWWHFDAFDRQTVRSRYEIID